MQTQIYSRKINLSYSRFSFLLFFLFVFLLSIQSINALRINEIELNPQDDCNDCTEWLEFYSESYINLEGWSIKDASGNIFNLSGGFEGYYILDNMSLSLNNNAEKIFLYNQSLLIQETPSMTDNDNNNKSWQYCNEIFVFASSTKSYSNTCQNNNTNLTNPDNPAENTETEDTSINIVLEDKNIINGEETQVKIKAYNLEDEIYDLKVWIEFEDKVISERYDEEKEEWKSGVYYINGAFDREGDQEKEISIRISSEYNESEGSATLYARLKRDETTIDEAERSLNIIKNQEENIEDNFSMADNKNQEEIIRLGSSEKIEEDSENRIIYKSKSEYIKEYAPYIFSLVCILVIIILIIERKWKK